MKEHVKEHMSAPRRRTWLLAIALIAGVSATTSGCATKGALSQRYDRGDAAVLRIDNRHWQDVKVYLVPASGGQSVRVATVVSMTSTVVRLRGRAAMEVRANGELRLEIRPFASRERFTTQTVLARPGDKIQLRVGTFLQHSTLMTSAR